MPKNFGKKGYAIVWLFILTFFIIIAVATDRLLPAITKNKYSNSERHIRLREHHILQDSYVVPSKVNMQFAEFLAKKKYRFRTDADGFIIPSKIHSKPDVTIVFLGGSTTECLFVNEDKRFPYLAGRLIESKTNVKINSYNSGVAGNNTMHLIDILLNKIIPINPDVLILMENFNDLISLLYDQSYWNNSPTRSLIVEAQPSIKGLVRDAVKLGLPNLGRLCLQIYLDFFPPDEWRHVRKNKININKPELVSQYKMNLETFVKLCETRNITLVFMTQANRLKESPDEIVRYEVDIHVGTRGVEYYEFKQIYDMFNQVMREVAYNKGIKLIDLAKEVPQEKEYIYDLVHYNERGCEYVSNIICDSLTGFIKNQPSR